MSILSRVGVPNKIFSDRGAQLTSNLMKLIQRLMSIKQLNTSPYYPMCNGMCEKFNDTLKKMIKRLAAERLRDWDRYLAPALFAYKEVPNETTGFSPIELLYGLAVWGPMHILK